MLSPFICGGFHAAQEEDEDDDEQQVFCFVRGNNNNKNKKNPFSTRGLDKFSALLDELEEKRRTIYSQTGSQDIFVRFVFSANSNDCKPIVVKLRNKNDQETQTQLDDVKDKPCLQNQDDPDKIPVQSEARVENSEKTVIKKSLISWDSGVRWSRPVRTRVKTVFGPFLRRPSYYIPAIFVLILLFLAVFGRTAAVICTCIGWYMVPTISGGSSNSLKVVKKKTYLRRLSENKKVVNEPLLSSPKFGNIVPTKKKDYVRKLSEN